MSADAVTRLNAALAGRYRVERQLGEGGMATVYLASDLRHERKVALKVLKPELAAVVGAERFLAEIKTTANLQHPHILPLFDSGEAGAFLFYVMPYVAGETLRERLDREHQLPVDEAVRIAASVADALDHAHRHGVIHRDVKPANILLQDGKPVISDFGIALAVSAGGAGRLTETGLSLGTPHYMSPEQATGDDRVRAPTDLWALACVLYEMLAGEPPYVASTPQAVLGKIITAEPPSASEARRSVPANVDAAIRRALEKVPADRFATASDFAEALADPGFRHGTADAPSSARDSRRLVATLTALCVGLAGLAAWGWMGRSADPARGPVTRLTAMLPADHRVAFPEWNVFPLALSADGRTLAYVGRSAEGTRLYVRRLDSYQATVLDGTRNATQPFFSPDGAWLAYFGSGWLSRVSVAGGAPIRITGVDGVPAGGAWGPDGLVVFARDSALWRVDAAGGTPEPVPWEAPGLVGWPSFLPDGAGGWRGPSVLVSAGNQLYAVSVLDGDARDLGVTTDGHGVFSRGVLIYSETSGVVRAVPFDPDDLRTTGTATSVLEDVLRPNLTDATVLTVSASGALAYMPGTSERRLVLVDRGGRETVLPFVAGAYRNVAVSPDGLRVATERRLEGPRLLDLVTGSDNAFPGGRGIGAAWSPNGREVLIVAQNRVQRFAASPGVRTPTHEIPMPRMSTTTQWGGDGVVVFHTYDQRAPNRGGIHAVRLDGDGSYETLLDTEADEQQATRSPDGRWIAYVSDVSGTAEVYARAFAGGEPKLVSVNGGDRAVFSRDGRELFYLSGERMYAVPTDRLDQAAPLEPELLFTGSYVLLGQSWDVRPQGDFVMVSAGPNWLREIQVVQGWTDELEARLAATGR